MSGTKLDIAFWDYDRAGPLVDGSVLIDGVDASYHTARIVPEIFERMIRGREFDVSELGMTYFLRTLDLPDPPFLALPVFLARSFRHSAIFVNKASGIEVPEDLAGKTIGELAVFGHDGGVMAKGILSDDYGVTPNQSRWIVGGIDFPLTPVDFVPQPHPDDVEVSWARADEDLGAMLLHGEIDALISADVPSCVLANAPGVGRLFEDYRTVEREYYQRTGIFPIMHVAVVDRKLAAENPAVVKAVYQAFCQAKSVTAEKYVQGMTFNNMSHMLPWMTALIDEDRSLLGADWWPYGMAANRRALDVILRYHHEQGLTAKQYRCEDIFVDYLLDT